jgi:CDP-diacylglycerol---glycerol-3-phosphate 3-phosphatidyltransferase
LNKSYFTDRQDRYLLFSSAPELSSYCFDFLKTASTFSYELLPSPIPGNTHPVLRWPHSSSSHPHHIESHAGLALSNFQRRYNAKSGNIQEQLQREDSVIIFPVIQAGQFNIREEEECLRELFYHLEAVDSRRAAQSFHPLLSLTTGYFGLFKSYKDLILRSHVPTHIICASPKVHVYCLSNMTNNSQSSPLGERFLRFQRDI